MRPIIAIIEKGSDGGYAIYSNEINGAIGSGMTEKEAKEEFEDALKEEFEFYEEKTGKISEYIVEGYSVEYKYDFSAFFEAFPFISATEFAKAVGINPSLMRKYKNKIAFASEKQKNLIQDKYQDIVKNMELVQF